MLSGQWIRFTCTAIEPEEFHSFTLTSAPHEDFLQVHVKAMGPWTWKLRNTFDKKINDKEEDKDMSSWRDRCLHFDFVARIAQKLFTQIRLSLAFYNSKCIWVLENVFTSS